MADGTLTATFDHLSDADATRTVLQSSIPGIDVELRSDAHMGSPNASDEQAAGPWLLTASVPDGMQETAEVLAEQTAPAAS